MSKPLGYWGCNYDHQLITDVMETFGDNLEHLPEADQAWLIGRCGDYCFVNSGGDQESSIEAETLVSRLHELSTNQIGCLIQAIANKSSCKPLTYWHCDENIELIRDIADVWEWNLQEMSEVDFYWLLARIGHYFWRKHCSDAPSDASQELADRIEMDELPPNQVAALIQALANK
jgi:hypothetical protein